MNPSLSSPSLRSRVWPFPLPRTHTGVPLGNGRAGALVWGGGRVLKITFGRADFWDHRSAKRWTPEMNYPKLYELLRAGNEPEIRRIFAEKQEPGQPRRSTVVPVGRIELRLPEGERLVDAELDFASAVVTVRIARAGGGFSRLALELSLDAPLLEIRGLDGAGVPPIAAVPAWEFVGGHLKSVGYNPPEPLSGGVDGWTQRTPGDGAVSVGWVRDDARGLVRIGVTHGEDLRDVLANGSCAGNAAWWGAYWARVPVIDVPDRDYAFLLTYGLYKFAGLTFPGGAAATLQGPWIEEYQMPPWSSDYHFNINVEMCYWPAYRAGLFEHLLPLFRMVESWLPTLRENARLFIGVDDGLLLPHAVDDRCGIIGAFWTGTLDHACTAWVARMMFDYWEYSGDDAFLRETAYPFMKGAMRVYEAMMERRADGSLSLPLGVSPEYRGAEMNAWGRDASFQLAACHTLAEALQRAAAALGEPPAPVWGEIREKLPLASLAPDQANGQPVVALWEGLALEESHRHHSHLAGIAPFDVFDPQSPEWRPILENSIRQWHRLGMGYWTGWCIPWAAMIHHRAGNPEVAAAMMHYWQSIYTNEGLGTLHDPQFSNANLTNRPPDPLAGGGTRAEVMQMDAGMCATATILDAMVHSRRGILYLFQGAPRAWRHCRFENVHAEGGFVLSARRGAEEVEWVRVKAKRDGTLRLGNPWPGDSRGPVIERTLAAGENVELTRQGSA